MEHASHLECPQSGQASPQIEKSTSRPHRQQYHQFVRSTYVYAIVAELCYLSANVVKSVHQVLHRTFVFGRDIMPMVEQTEERGCAWTICWLTIRKLGQEKFGKRAELFGTL